MSIGPDIKEVFEEFGTPINIRKHSGAVVSGEYLDYDLPTNATSTFLVNFTLEASFSYDTLAKGGDIIEFATTGQRYLLALKNAERFEDANVAHEARLYKCNEWGHVKRRSVTRPGTNTPGGYRSSSIWAVVASGEDVLVASNAAYSDSELEDYGLFDTDIENLHISGNVDIQIGDRFEIPSIEKFQILNISKRRLNNVYICRVQKDERQ